MNRDRSMDELAARGMQALRSGALGRAERMARDGLKRRSDEPRCLEILVQALAGQQKYADAVGAMERLVRAGPGNARYRLQLGKLLRMAGRADEAERTLRDLVESRPDDVEALYTLAFLLRDRGQWDEAGGLVREFAGRVKDEEEQLRAAGFLWETGDAAGAGAILDAILERDPKHPRANPLAGKVREALGNYDGALACYRQALADKRDRPGAWLRLTLFRRVTDARDPDLAPLTAAAADTGLSIESRACAAFALAKAYDDLGQPERAFDYLSEANAAWRKGVKWSAEEWRRQVEAVIGSFPEISSAEPAPSGPRPVFIVGMLRSGTTLLERELSRHPEIQGRGELNFLRDLAGRLPPPGFPRVWPSLPRREKTRIRELLLEQMVRGGGATAYIDKNPLNFRYLGVIAELFPEALIIHMRRDPRDVGLSLYMQALEDPESGYAFSLDDIVAFHDGYLRLMDHWKERMGDRIVEVEYENLVADPGAVLGRIAGELGLSWRFDESRDDAAGIRTASVWQARQPIHGGSVARWRRYEPYAGSFFRSLAGGGDS